MCHLIGARQGDSLAGHKCNRTTKERNNMYKVGNYWVGKDGILYTSRIAALQSLQD